MSIDISSCLESWYQRASDLLWKHWEQLAVFEHLRGSQKVGKRCRKHDQDIGNSNSRRADHMVELLQYNNTRITKTSRWVRGLDNNKKSSVHTTAKCSRNHLSQWNLFNYSSSLTNSYQIWKDSQKGKWQSQAGPPTCPSECTTIFTGIRAVGKFVSFSKLVQNHHTQPKNSTAPGEFLNRGAKTSLFCFPSFPCMEMLNVHKFLCTLFSLVIFKSNNCLFHALS